MQNATPGVCPTGKKKEAGLVINLSQSLGSGIREGSKGMPFADDNLGTKRVYAGSETCLMAPM